MINKCGQDIYRVLQLYYKGDDIMSIISLRLSDTEKKILENASAMYNGNVSLMIKNIVFQKLEDDYDLRIIEEYEESKKNGSLELMEHDDFWKELGL